MNLSDVDWCKKDFDHITWVNNLLQNKQEITLEECTANIVRELNAKKKQTNTQLGKISRNLYKNIPELMNEVVEVQKAVGQLRNEVHAMRQTIDAIETKNAAFMRSLNAIESLRNRVENQKSNLEQRENWNSFEKDFVVMLTDDGAFENAAKQLCYFRDSAASDAPDKHASFERLKNDLVATVTKRFRDELVERKTDACAKKFAILTELETVELPLSLLETYYNTCVFGDSWQKYAANYHEFCKYLAVNWRSEMEFLRAIAGEAMSAEHRANFLVKLAGDFITKSRPQLKNPQDFTGALLLKNTVCKLLEQIVDCDRDSFVQLTRTLFEPLRLFFENWPRYETEQLAKLVLIGDVVAESAKNPLKIDFSRLNSTVTVNVAVAFENASKRCQDLSQFRAVSIVLDAFDGFFADTHRDFCTGILGELQARFAASAVANRSGHLPDNFWNLFQVPVHLLKHLANCLSSLNDCNVCLVQKISNQIVLDNEAQDPTYFILSRDHARYWDTLVTKITDGEQSFELFSRAKTYFTEISTSVFRVLVDILSSVAIAQFNLRNLSFLDTKSDQFNDFNQPQEYITIIGQYLITLPQNLEPFFMRNDYAMIESLKLAESKFGAVPNDDNFPACVILIVIEVLAQKICNLFIDMIFDCPQLTAANCSQLVTDISYLENVLEDLGVGLTTNLLDVSKLLVVPADGFLQAASGISTKIAFTIKQIRGPLNLNPGFNKAKRNVLIPRSEF